MPKRQRCRKSPSERPHARPTRHERQTIERMLDRGRREIAHELDQAPSTVANEMGKRRFVTSPRARYGEPAAALAVFCQLDLCKKGPRTFFRTRPRLGRVS